MIQYKCTDCGQVYDGNLEVCPNCGCPTKYQTVQISQEKKLIRYKCTDCGQEYDGELEACPNCGCPTKCQTEQVEQPSRAIDHSQDNISQERNEVKLAIPINSGVGKMVARKCPACNAPLKTDSYNAKKTVCEYCGQTIYFVSEDKDWCDDDVDCLVLLPRETDENCKTKLLEKLTLTDYVPVKVFDSLDFDSVRHNLYPVYVFDVNWSANWTAVYSYMVSRQVPDYDYQGKRIGMKTEWETKYRDANGTSAGNAMVFLSGLSEGFSNQSMLCEKYTELLLGNPETIEKEVKRLADTDIELFGWNRINHNLKEQEAWQRGGEDILAQYVDSGVQQSVWKMANGCAVNNSDYTYRYHNKSENKVMIPIWETDFRYDGKPYTASVDVWYNELIMENYPKEESAEDQKNEIQAHFDKYKGLRATGFILFGFFSVLFIASNISLIENTHSSAGILPSVLCGIAVLLTWGGARKEHLKIMDLENSVNNKLWIDKKQRQAAVQKKFGINVEIGKEPRMRKMSCVSDIIIIFLITIIVIVNVIQYLT